MDHFLVALFGAGGAATVLALFKGVSLLLAATGQFRAGDRRSLAEEWQQVLNVQQAEAVALRDEVDKLSSDLRKCELAHEQDKAWRQRAQDWIEDAQAVLADKGIPIRRWKPEPQPRSDPQPRPDPVPRPDPNPSAGPGVKTP